MTGKRLFGVVIAVLCAPLAPFVIARYMSIVYFARSRDGSEQKSKPSRVKLVLSLLNSLVTLSSLNVIVGVIQRTKVNSKVARHLYAIYMATAIVAVFDMAALMRPSLDRSR
jgi:hypothetical protein